jgi:hypothetical protein
MVIALRFLKETGLLPFWKEYVIKEINERNRFITKHWSMNANIINCIDQIFGLTNFTDFVIRKIEKKRNQLNNGEHEISYVLPPIYLLFGAWLTANSSLYGEYTLEGGTPSQSVKSHIIVDTKRRKTTILLDEYFGSDWMPKRVVSLGQVLKEINALC